MFENLRNFKGISKLTIQFYFPATSVQILILYSYSYQTVYPVGVVFVFLAILGGL